MKSTKNVFIAIAIILAIIGCSKNNFDAGDSDISAGQNDSIPENPDDTLIVDPDLKELLLGKWIEVFSFNSGIDEWYFVEFTEDTIYESCHLLVPSEGFLSSYQIISQDSISINRIRHNHNVATHNKVLFYSNDTLFIEDFWPTWLQVSPPIFDSWTFVRYTEY